MYKHKESGFVAIASVLVIAVVVLVIGVSVSLTSVNEVQSSLASKKSIETVTLVEACAEIALLQLREENTISSSITLPEVSCSVTIDSQAGDDWKFSVSASFEKYTKSIQIDVTNGASLTINSWGQI